MTICVLLALAAGRAAHAQNAVHAVLVVHRVINAGDKEAAAVTAHCILPATNRYQEVLDVQIDPEPSETHVDALGQEVISVPLGPIPPGESRAVRVMIWTRLKPVNVPLLAAPAAGLELRPEIRDALLEDGFLLNLAKLRPIAEKAIGRAATDVDKARKLFEYMSKNCQYGVDEHILSADAILGGKPASCSELAYTYIGLCRSVGIPARVVSAYVNREGAAPSTDWQTHRWAEFFSEGFGWVPADPTNRINNPTKNFFGRQDGQ